MLLPMEISYLETTNPNSSRLKRRIFLDVMVYECKMSLLVLHSYTVILLVITIHLLLIKFSLFFLEKMLQ